MFKRTRVFLNRRKERLSDKAKKVVGAEEIKRNWEETQGTWKRLTRKKKGRQETFANAYQRLGLNEEKLAQSHKYHSTRFYIFSIAAALAISFGIISLLRGSYFSVLVSLGTTAFLGALAFQASFVLYQIERRELVDVAEWLRHPGSWIPAPFQTRSGRGRDLQRRS